MVSGVVYTIKEVGIVWVSSLNYVELAKNIIQGQSFIMSPMLKKIYIF